MPESTRRPFATGSKPGPDAVDHYLETQGYYRKHVARDASSLFRAVSEQIFDIQNYHEKVRQDCADFMEANSKDYSNEVDKNLYNYISNLRKARTHGTLLELRVLARKYRRNVVLFEPTQNLQTTNLVYVQNDEYNENKPMRLFYSHKDNHFDVIYTMEYVERLAECQAIVYMLLYKEVYRLPDVPYAVERMLHDQEEQVTLPLPGDPSKYSTQSGEVIEFDLPEETNCVLKDPKTCHFHNQTNFEEVVDENKDAITVINRTDEPGRLKIFKPIDGFLHDKEKSCVRQLLDEHITPFPYKVAKALDSSIYRNTEFELWSENRKEQRMKWLDSAEFPMKPHFEDKWVLYDRRGMRKSFDAIVDENAYMAMDDEMKKKYVVLNPAAEPFKLHHLTSLNHFVPSKDSLDLTVMPVNGNFNRGGNFKGNKRGGRYHNRDFYGNNHFQNRSGHYNQQQQQPQMPHVSEIEGREGCYPPQEQQEMQPGYYQQTTQTEPENYDHHQQPQMQAYQAYQQPQQWPKPMPVPMSPYPPGQQIHFIPQQPMGYQNVMPYGNFSIPPPNPPEIQFQQAGPVSEPASVDGDCMNLMREAELASTVINFKPKESVEPNGSDLPLNDLLTVQFYYNIGVRYFLGSGVQRRLESVATQLENLEITEGSDKNDPPPVPTNTPVTTKMGFSQGGNRQQHQGGSNFRRQGGNNNGNGGNYRNNWNNNNNNGGNNNGHRKEIRFNSNVKNVHKNDAKAGTAAAPSLQAPAKTKDASTTPKVQDKTSPPSQYSPLSPIMMEPPSQYQAPPVDYQQAQQQQQQFYQYPQTFIPPAPGISLIYQYGEEGGYNMMQPMPQQAYQYPQYQNQPPTPHFQPMFQPAGFAPGTPVYYQTVPNYPQQQHLLDGSAVSNDSGMVEATAAYQTPQPIQYYQQYPQVIYTQTPVPQTPQLAPPFSTAPAVVPHAPQEAAAPQTEEQSVKNA